jgi:uncharacterized membrane protein YhaH (DUF805 family)
MGFGEAIRRCFSKYATFSGRARRSEFWFFWLLLTAVDIIYSVIEDVLSGGLVGRLVENASGKSIDGSPVAPVLYLLGLALLLLHIAMLLPALAVFVRRLHDIDRTGWWVLLLVAPMIAGIIIFTVISAVPDNIGVVGGGILVLIVVELVIWIVFLIWLCQRGTVGPNRYGTDPLGAHN